MTLPTKTPAQDMGARGVEAAQSARSSAGHQALPTSSSGIGRGHDWCRTAVRCDHGDAAGCPDPSGNRSSRKMLFGLLAPLGLSTQMPGLVDPGLSFRPRHRDGSVAAVPAQRKSLVPVSWPARVRTVGTVASAVFSSIPEQPSWAPAVILAAWDGSRNRSTC